VVERTESLAHGSGAYAEESVAVPSAVNAAIVKYTAAYCRFPPSGFI
jgi:hypothetical protein